MTLGFTSEVKHNMRQVFLTTARETIKREFSNDRDPKTITVDNGQIRGTISRQCHTDTPPRRDRVPYFEDYRVYLERTTQNEKLWAKFYLEWKNEVMDTELFNPSGNIVINIIRRR